MTRHLLTFALTCALLLLNTAARAAELPPLTHEIVLNAPAEKVWSAFSTAEGYKLWGVAQVDIDFRVGGKIRTTYSADGKLGDAGTIEQTILAYEPMRMIAFSVSKCPEGFPFPNAITKTWNVAYIEDLGGGRTRLTLKGMGYDDSEESKKMREFFDAGNAWSMQKLRANLEETPAPTTSAHDAANAGQSASSAPTLLSTADGESPIEVEAMIHAPIDDVWNSWTTSEGIASFVGRPAKVILAPGGPFEIYFDDKGPEGQRGSEGCTILAYEPKRVLAFTWNAPPKLAHARGERTWVVVTLEEADAGTTRVRLTHHGFKEKIASQPSHADEWRECRTYFVNAWPKFLGALQAKYAK